MLQSIGQSSEPEGLTHGSTLNFLLLSLPAVLGYKKERKDPFLEIYRWPMLSMKAL